MANDLSDSPIFEKYRPYQMGFVQDRHNALGSELDLFIKFFGVKSVTTKQSFAKKAEALLKEKLISKQLYDDLQLINRARNRFVKSLTKPNEKEIRNLLNNVKSLSWKKEKRNKYSLYRLLLICMGSMHQEFSNTPNYRKYLKAIGIIF